MCGSQKQNVISINFLENQMNQKSANHKSNQSNPNNPTFQHVNNNRSNQGNPNNPAHHSSRATPIVPKK
ncbi:Hypothetical protein HEAR0506 [Herminiimonas arsenicoxydans]|uniref:Uncharacterized protein n=1 Tax=Herminiimonas arsenicoxydans TaxID=204773 RepID=A4G2H9_HERAR|nr:Hypothetical protein HEAR0506 [Herminiimonas arsenicoxydans]